MVGSKRNRTPNDEPKDLRSLELINRVYLEPFVKLAQPGNLREPAINLELVIYPRPSKEMETDVPMSGEFTLDSPEFDRCIENPPHGTILFDTLPDWVKEKLETGPENESSHLKCGFCGSQELKQALKICVKCQLQKSRSPAHYCSKTCQVNDWPRHKLTCKVASTQPPLKITGSLTKKSKTQSKENSSKTMKRLHKWQNIHEKLLIWFTSHIYHTHPDVDPSMTFLAITLLDHKEQRDEEIPLLWPVWLRLVLQNVSKGWDPMLTHQLHRDNSSIWMCYELKIMALDARPIYSQSVPKDWHTVFMNDWDMVGEHLLFFINISLSHSATQYEVAMKWLPKMELDVIFMFFQFEKWPEMLQEVKLWEQMEESGVMKNVMAAGLSDIPMPPPPESQRCWTYSP